MAEVIGLYNRSGHRECYRHMMDFIVSYPETPNEIMQYAINRAEDIPIKAGTTPEQIVQFWTDRANTAAVTEIETKYGNIVPGFRLSDYPYGPNRTGAVYNGMTARVLDLSDSKDIGLAARLGKLTDCSRCLESAGETAMMHGFLNPNAGFWVVEDADGTVKAQAEIWVTEKGVLVFDSIEPGVIPTFGKIWLSDTDDRDRTEKLHQLRGMIAAWAMESGYKNIIMGCGHNGSGTEAMKQAPVPKLRLTPEEVFILQKNNDAGVSFQDINGVYRYMLSGEYDPADFVYTDTDEKCVYIKKNGKVSDYLMGGYDRTLANEHCTEQPDTPERSNGCFTGQLTTAGIPRL